MEGKKISELTGRNLSLEEVKQGQIYIPILEGNGNNKILISNIYDLIRASIIAEVNDTLAGFISGGSSGDSTPSSGPSQSDFNSLVNRVSYLETRINTPTEWPTNYIGIKDINTNNTIYYALPSGPGQSGIKKDEIVIAQSDVTLPDMYFTAALTTVSVLNGLIVTFTPSTREGGVGLGGGTVNYLQISGTLRTSSGSYDIEESLLIGGNNGVTFAGNTATFSPESYQVTESISNVTGTINHIELKAKVGVVRNNQVLYVEIPGAVVYYESGDQMMGLRAAGYVTLPTNGS